MDESEPGKAQQIAEAARAYEQRTVGRLPGSVSVVLSVDTLVITLRGTLSPAELALAKSQEGAARIRELHRQLFATGSETLRRKIRQITGVEVCEATAELETSTGTVVQVYLLAHPVPPDSWSGSDPGPATAEQE